MKCKDLQKTLFTHPLSYNDYVNVLQDLSVKTLYLLIFLLKTEMDYSQILVDAVFMMEFLKIRGDNLLIMNNLIFDNIIFKENYNLSLRLTNISK